MTGWFDFPDGAQATRIRTRRLAMFTVTAGLAATPSGGPPVVLIHGLGWDSSLWYPTMADLASRHSVLAADTRGHGESDKPPGPYSIAGFAEDWAALLDHRGLSAACVVGLSQGGMVAQQLALTRPDLVSRLVLVATACRSRPGARANMESRLAAMETAGPAAAAMVAAESIFSPAWRDANPGELARFLNWRQMAPAAPLTEAMRALYDYDLSARLPAINVPTLILSGGADTLTKPEAQREIAGLISGAELRTIATSGHMIPVEAPAQFSRLLREFLSRESSSQFPRGS